jgi:hypothetical protein
MLAPYFIAALPGLAVAADAADETSKAGPRATGGPLCFGAKCRGTKFSWALPGGASWSTRIR